MGFESIDQPGQSSEVECNPKMSILFFWLERGGRWGSSPLTSLADHQKLNVIQKWAFYFLAEEGWQMGFESIIQPSRSSEVERNPKMSIYICGWRGVTDGVRAHRPARPIIRSWMKSNNEHLFFWQMGFQCIDQPGQSSEVEHSPKMSISFFSLERGGRRGLSPLTRLADHQKLNVIQ